MHKAPRPCRLHKGAESVCRPVVHVSLQQQMFDHLISHTGTLKRAKQCSRDICSWYMDLYFSHTKVVISHLVDKIMCQRHRWASVQTWHHIIVSWAIYSCILTSSTPYYYSYHQFLNGRAVSYPKKNIMWGSMIEVLNTWIKLDSCARLESLN
jgi:hypothetical protein